MIDDTLDHVPASRPENRILEEYCGIGECYFLQAMHPVPGCPFLVHPVSAAIVQKRLSRRFR